MERPWLVGGGQNNEMRDVSTSCLRRRGFVCFIGFEFTEDIGIAPIKQITLFARNTALCAAEKPDEVMVSIRCRPLVSTETKG